jgi:hypothetical protein
MILATAAIHFVGATLPGSGFGQYAAFCLGMIQGAVFFTYMFCPEEQSDG